MGRLAVFLLAALLAGCATTGERDPKDPWEGFNRGSFSFNEKLAREWYRFVGNHKKPLRLNFAVPLRVPLD